MTKPRGDAVRASTVTDGARALPDEPHLSARPAAGVDPYLRLAQAFAASIVQAPGPTIEEAARAVDPSASLDELYFDTLVAAADALCGQDVERWSALLCLVAAWRPAELLAAAEHQSRKRAYLALHAEVKALNLGLEI